MTDTNPELTAPCAACVSRRQFLARSAMVAATAAVAAACGNGQIGPTAVTVPNSNGSGNHLAVITVGKYAGLANTGTLVQINNFVAVKRLGATSFTAFSMVCTHQGCLTSLSGNTFFCPCHGSTFDSNGRATRGPASVPLQQYATSYDAATDELTIG